MLGFSALGEYALNEFPADGSTSAAVTGTGAVTLDLFADASGTFTALAATVGTGAVTLSPVADAQGAQGVTGTGAVSITPTVAAGAGHGVAGAGASSVNPSAAAAGGHGIAGAAAATITPTCNAAALHLRYEVRGEVRQGGVLVNRRVRLYRRDTGVMLGEQDTVVGRFAIQAGFAEIEHYIVPIHLDDAATDWTPPVANRVLSVLAQDV